MTVKRLAKGLVFRAQQVSRRRDLDRKLESSGGDRAPAVLPGRRPPRPLLDRLHSATTYYLVMQSAANSSALLDINCHGNGVSQYQMTNGSLFNEFTAEVLDHSEAHLHRLRNAT